MHRMNMGRTSFVRRKWPRETARGEDRAEEKNHSHGTGFLVALLKAGGVPLCPTPAYLSNIHYLEKFRRSLPRYASLLNLTIYVGYTHKMQRWS